MPVLLIIMEMQIKSQWLYYFTTARMGISKKTKKKIHRVLMRMEKKEPLHNTLVLSEAAIERGVKIKPKIFT